MGSEAAIVSKSSSSSGQKFFPPGFRFHPTDEELVLYYLKRKVCGRSLKLDIIGEIDVNKWEPEELPGQSKWKTGDRQWFFFSPRDRKYPNGGRSNRGTMHGYWKATGKDRIIKCNSRLVGLKKTLVYYHGRAPSGQRTDWVMHEYTLNAEELDRCRYVQEYYALYKVFKKSGPGPKNGEQYGAPFVEEEWNKNDDYVDVEVLLVQNINTLVTVSKLTSGITVEPEINPANGKEESKKSFLAPSSSKVDDIDKRIAMGPSHEPLVVQQGFDSAQPANEPYEVTSVEELQPLVNEDFLEMDDLLGPQPAFQNSELPVVDDLQFGGFDGFCAFDFYNDSTEFNEMNPFESQQIQLPYDMSNVDYGIESCVFHSYSNGSGSEAVNTEFPTGYDLWTHDQHDQHNNNFRAAQGTEAEAQATDVAISAPSGTVFAPQGTEAEAQATDVTIATPSGDEKPGKSNSGVNQCRKMGEDDGSYSWFSSALWGFVESVPSSPVSALESSALVNKMCSISRISNANGGGCGNVERSLASRRVERLRRGIVFYSVLGVLLAILCASVRTSIELLGRYIL